MNYVARSARDLIFYQYTFMLLTWCPSLTEHVWNVTIRERDLGKTYIGEYRLCLNDRTVIFVKKACVDPSLVFPVSYNKT